MIDSANRFGCIQDGALQKFVCRRKPLIDAMQSEGRGFWLLRWHSRKSKSDYTTNIGDGDCLRLVFALRAAKDRPRPLRESVLGASITSAQTTESLSEKGIIRISGTRYSPTMAATCAHAAPRTSRVC